MLAFSRTAAALKHLKMLRDPAGNIASLPTGWEPLVRSRAKSILVLKHTSRPTSETDGDASLR